ncbi:MAG: Helix-hairpin-helix DNA-binding class 1, partial [Gemmatimonadetes bacterium]|nr:Helix-hairpin-helix DNA-binding class 1 [Gemmatimonadota bacterium]
RRDRPQGASSLYDPRAGWINGYPPPSARIDLGPAAPGAPGAPGSRRAPTVGGPDSLPIDLDVATAEELDRLPRIGPGTAARILANRDSFGPFRSLAGLGRVRGMGPATLRRLAPRVTFSGRAASITAGNRRP